MRKRSNPVSITSYPPAKRRLVTDAIGVDLKCGTILTDILGKKWRLGKTIGIGGFGLIYLVSDNIKEDVKSDAQYVAKVESHTSGPLFVERNCYLLIAKPDMIHEWKENNKLDYLGMPHYVASGSHSTTDVKYRFMILPRFEQDLDQMFEAKKRKFNFKTVITIALQTINVLQYIHSKGYVHSDIKASNIMLAAKSKIPTTTPTKSKMVFRYHGCTPVRTCKARKMVIKRTLRPNINLRYLNEESFEEVDHNSVDEIYLVDYGLASKYRMKTGVHKEYCGDLRKAHAGTILFCSRDAHNGAQSRRSDLECLGFNLIYWLTSDLPWSCDTEHPEKVHQKKRKCIENIKEFLDFCFDLQWPRFLLDYFTYLISLEFEAEPDYNYCKTLFKQALNEYGYKDNLLLDFDNLEGWGRKQKRTKPISDNMKMQLKFKGSPLKSNLAIKPRLRKKNDKKVTRKMKWSEILDPEIIIKQAKSRERKMTESSDTDTPMGILDLHSLNPTAAMMDAFHRARDRSNNIGGVSPRCRGDVGQLHIEGYNAAMMQVYNRMKEVEAMELEQIMNSKSRSRSNSRSQPKKRAGGNKTSKRAIRNSPPCKRPAKTQSNAVVAKKEAPKLRKCYSLRG